MLPKVGATVVEVASSGNGSGSFCHRDTRGVSSNHGDIRPVGNNERWPHDWLEFLETCRTTAVSKGVDQPWVCPCGKAVGLGSPQDASDRQGNALWCHLCSSVGKGQHPGKDQLDIWEQQWSHSQQQKATPKRKKWGTASDLLPYIEKLDPDSLGEVKRKIEEILSERIQ